MKIAQVSPLYESVPPKLYGGTERVVSYLTEELIQQGHEVTLFASGDSYTSARLQGHVKEALRLNPKVKDPLAHHIVQLQEVIEHSDEFDIIHFHTDYLHFPVSALLKNAHITTLHGRIDIPDLQYVYNKFKEHPVVSISNSQRMPVPQANWVGTVYHGLPLDLYTQGSGEGEYLAFIGRISPEKRPDRAIEIARKAGMKIKVAAKIDKADEAYYKQSIKKLMAQPHVEFVGEIGETEKNEFLGNAKALLFPIDWPEPFGMVMIEAMACGTPVIAYENGSVPEVIDKGESGFLVNSIEEAVRAVNNIDLLDRTIVRNCFEKRFSAKVMAENYLMLYHQLVPLARASYSHTKQPEGLKRGGLLAS
ncbi:glycosyltransferase family 4 protein [Porifericola rhodea]|uniref:glycosyltransferase family 4 protein n=1 Tax=Porifericola rhodea TaxID=930972 RepID=UPI002665908E|nr:glycosyltransferase family 4 protein [Porifericola rhodea]WKN29887.1 glycosyltransferase family 4 protein [Porifericola rhodea]